MCRPVSVSAGAHRGKRAVEWLGQFGLVEEDPGLGVVGDKIFVPVFRNLLVVFVDSGF